MNTQFLTDSHILVLDIKNWMIYLISIFNVTFNGLLTLSFRKILMLNIKILQEIDGYLELYVWLSDGGVGWQTVIWYCVLRKRVKRSISLSSEGVILCRQETEMPSYKMIRKRNITRRSRLWESDGVGWCCASCSYCAAAVTWDLCQQSQLQRQ